MSGEGSPSDGRPPANPPGGPPSKVPSDPGLPAWMSARDEVPLPPPTPVPGPGPDRPAPPLWAPPLVVRDTSPGPGVPAPWTLAASNPPPDAAAPARVATAPAAPAAEVGERSALGWFRDNLEAFAFAILLALLLRHLCVEVFKIPTSSMEPTLLGDHSSRSPGTAGDRILVDKTAYLFHGPDRWDVAVFRFPLDWSRNFIKRVAGLPGERLKIVRGDVWVAQPPVGDAAPVYHPARKPKRARDQLYTRIYPPPTNDGGRLPSAWWDDETPGRKGWAPVASFRELRFPGDADAALGVTPPPAILRYHFTIHEQSRSSPDLPSGDRHPTPDVRVRGTLRTHGPAELVLEWRPGDGRTHTMRLATKGRGASEATTARATRALPALVEVGSTAFELESVDGDLRVTLDGEEAAVLADELSVTAAAAATDPSDPQALTFSARGFPLELLDLEVAHDLYYTQTGRPEDGDAWRIPDDAYFMLGDNTRNSNDSRAWSANGIRLATGEEIWFDPSPSGDEEPRYPRYPVIGGVTYEERRDTEGVVRRWAPSDLEPGAGSLSRKMPFVTRERIVGRAWFAMYADVDVWPLKVPKVTTGGRIRFIH